MIIVFLFYIGIPLLLAFKNPTYFVIYYLLSSSKFLGFFDPELFFVFGGLGLASPALNFIALFAAFALPGKRKIPKNMLVFSVFILIFIAYGIFAPMLAGVQSLMQSLIASKQYWSLFLFIYLSVSASRIVIHQLLYAIKVLGVVISFSYIMHLAAGFSAPFYISNGVFRAFYPTFISLALFIFFHEFISRKINMPRFILFLSILFAGMIIAGHKSLVYGSIVCLLACYLYQKRKGGLEIKVLFTLLIGLVLTMNMLVETKTAQSVIARANSIMTGEEAALSSRAIYNEFRWNAINDKPLLGYGFIHQGSSLVDQYKIIENNRFAERFSVIDSGYVDLLVAFGYIGTVAYLLILALTILKYGIRNRANDTLKLSMGFYLIQYFLVNYTWSVWSFSHGLIPGFVAIFLIMHEGKYAKTHKTH